MTSSSALHSGQSATKTGANMTNGHAIAAAHHQPEGRIPSTSIRSRMSEPSDPRHSASRGLRGAKPDAAAIERNLTRARAL